MNKLKFRRNYKYILFFLFLIFVSVLFSQTRIISYNFGRYVTELEVKKEDITNDINVYDDSILHNITIDISNDEYNELLEFYINNDDKYFIEKDIIIDGVVIENVGIKLKGNKLVDSSIELVDLSTIDFSLLIKFDQFNVNQSYLGMTELALISGTVDDLKGEYIANKLFESFGVTTSSVSFSNVNIGGFINKYYLIKEVVNDEFLVNNYGDTNGLLYKAENSMSFTYLGEDPTLYVDLFSQKTLENNYDMKKLIEILYFVSNSTDEEFKLNGSDYINIENYIKFLVVNDYIYSSNEKLNLFDSYYIYFDLGTETIKFIPWDANYITNIETTDTYSLLKKIYENQDIGNLSNKDVREILDNFSDTENSILKDKYKNDLESIVDDKDTFKYLYEELEEQFLNEIGNTNFISNIEIKINNLLNNN